MDQDTGEIRHEVEEAREALGETVEALAYKANAPKRLKDQALEKANVATTKLAHVKQRASEQANRAKEQIQADPRAQDAERRINAAKEAISNARNPQPTPADAAPSRPQQPSVSLIKQHPTATAAAAAALTAGIVLGRITSRN